MVGAAGAALCLIDSSCPPPRALRVLLTYPLGALSESADSYEVLDISDQARHLGRGNSISGPCGGDPAGPAAWPVAVTPARILQAMLVETPGDSRSNRSRDAQRIACAAARQVLYETQEAAHRGQKRRGAHIQYAANVIHGEARVRNLCEILNLLKDGRR